jgi:hypothetical protein
LSWSGLAKAPLHIAKTETTCRGRILFLSVITSVLDARADVVRDLESDEKRLSVGKDLCKTIGPLQILRLRV